MILATHHLTKHYDTKCVFKDVTFHMEAGQRLALVGPNGAGKTTLLRLILGYETADEGEIIIQKGLKLGYLPQTAELSSDECIEDELLKVFLPLRRMEEKMTALEKEISENDSAESTTALLLQYARLQEQYERDGGFEYRSRVRGVMAGLGFLPAEFRLPIVSLSGGQKSRVALSKLLLQQPDLLLLDEPTNHLDIEAIRWLENYLQSYRGALLLISHDRYFLDRLCDRTLEIEQNAAEYYNGSYSYYAEEKKKRFSQRMREYEAQQAEIARQEKIIETLRSYQQEKFIKRAQSREKVLEKMELIEKPISYEDAMRLKFVPKITSGSDVCAAHDVTKCFEGKHLFTNVNFLIKRGERVALLGSNGSGKTTLFRMIMEREKATAGNIDLGVKVYTGYYDQEQNDLCLEKTILDEIYDTYPQLSLTEIRNILAAFLFRGDDVFKPIHRLSGGEKARVALCKIMLSQSNFLLLDEPTNHLDIMSREILEQNLRAYEGTLFFISHDRYFINNVATRILVLTPDGVQSFAGNYDEYLAALDSGIFSATVTDDAAKTTATGFSRKENDETKRLAAAKTEAKAEAKAAYWQGRQNQAELRKKRARLRALEQEIAGLEDKIFDLGRQMEDPANYMDAKKYEILEVDKQIAEDKLDAAYAEWDGLGEELEHEN